MLSGQEAQSLGIANHSVQQNSDGDAAYQRSLKLAQEIVPQVSSDSSVYELDKDTLRPISIFDNCITLSTVLCHPVTNYHGSCPLSECVYLFARVMDCNLGKYSLSALLLFTSHIMICVTGYDKLRIHYVLGSNSTAYG